MINIISRSLVSDTTSGPKKVVENLIKGLDIIGYPYVINKRLDACERLWIHDDVNALKKLRDIDPKIKTVIGPNLFIRPRNIPENLDISKSVFICPSKWSLEFWTDFGFNKCKVDCWPAGIDTDQYKPDNSTKNIVLIYFKQRYKEELKFITDTLEKQNTVYKIIHYGSYKEKDYQKLLKKSKYIIWIGRHETQGIALQEALSMNIPILVCEIKNLGHWSPNEKERKIFNDEDNSYSKAQVAPFFNERCGIKIKNLNDLSISIKEIENNLTSYCPRKYILENLSLEKQARDFIFLYEKHFGLNYDSGLKEKVLKKGNWINASFRYIIYFKVKKFIKKMLKNH